MRARDGWRAGNTVQGQKYANLLSIIVALCSASIAYLASMFPKLESKAWACEKIMQRRTQGKDCVMWARCRLEEYKLCEERARFMRTDVRSSERLSSKDLSWDFHVTTNSFEKEFITSYSAFCGFTSRRAHRVAAGATPRCRVSVYGPTVDTRFFVERCSI